MKKIYAIKDFQHDSTKFGDVGSQLPLLPQKSTAAPISDELIFAQPDRLAAFRLAQVAAVRTLANGEHLPMTDKDFYGPLGMDKGTWSRVQTGDAHFPINKWFQYQKLCGNVIPLKYDAYHMGFELVPLRNDLERRVAELEQQLTQERHDRQVERDYERLMREGR